MHVIPEREETLVDYAAGETIEVAQYDGSVLRLHKLDPDYSLSDRIAASNYVQQHHAMWGRS